MIEVPIYQEEIFINQANPGNDRLVGELLIRMEFSKDKQVIRVKTPVFGEIRVLVPKYLQILNL